MTDTTSTENTSSEPREAPFREAVGPLALLFLTFGLIACQPGGEGPKPTLVVENGRVIVGDGPVLEDASVVVAGDSILSITQDAVDAPNARRIDASGKSVLPGLIDAHVHLTVPPGDSAAFVQHLDERVPEVLRRFLEHGVTTVRSMGGYWSWIGHLRDSVATGSLAGPRIKTAGPIVTAKGGHPATTICKIITSDDRPDPFCRSHLTREVTGPREARETVQTLADQGVDFIKFVSDGLEVEHPAPAHPPQIKDSVVEAVIDQAHREGLKALGHVAEADFMERYAEMDIDGFAHPATARRSRTDDRVRRLARVLTEHETPITTTMSVFLFVRPPGPVIEGTAPRWRNRVVKARAQEVSLLAEHDVPIVVGSDWCGCYPNTSKSSVHPAIEAGAVTITEMKMLRRGEMSQEAIIKAATANAARALEMSGKVGTLEEGKLADLIVVDGNPLEDLSVLEDPEVVVQGGDVVSTD